MYWIDLPGDWFSYSAQEKFLWCLKNLNIKLIKSHSKVLSDTYFISCGNEHGNIIKDIAEYDFSYITSIEKSLMASLDGLVHDETEFIVRLTAAEMLKKCPLKLYSNTTENIEPTNALQADVKKVPDTKPPEFFYPL